MMRGWRMRLQRTGWLLLATLLSLPGTALAWPGKFTSCVSCHTATQPTATISVALNAVAGTTITVAPGGTFEVDWVFTNMAAASAVGAEIAVPAGWTVAAGTVNSPALTGWNSVWDLAASGVWQGSSKAPISNSYSTATQFPASPEGRTINYAGTGWDTGTRDAAADNGGTFGGTDLDGVANRMGADARVTVPAGTANGTYIIQVTGIGHATGGKGYITQAITVTVSSGGGDATAPTPGTVSVSPQSGTFVPAAFTVTTPFTDNESAVTACDYTLNGGGAWTAGVVSGSLPNFTCTANITGQTNGTALSVNMRATSTGGTATATPVARTVDAAAPTTSSNAPVGWQAADASITLTPNDGTGSGVASTQYCVDTTNSCVPGTAGTTVLVTQGAGTAGTQYVRFGSTDNMSNVETTKSATAQIDKAAPTDGTLSITPGNTQNALSWTAAGDVGSGLRAANTYDLRFLVGATPPSCATGTSVYTGTGTSYTHTGLTNGSQYSYRLCAYDSVNNVSMGAFGSGTPALVNNPPAAPLSVSLTQFQSDGSTAVARGAFTRSASPVFKGQVTDPEGDTVQIEVEIVPYTNGFTNIPNCTSAAPVASGSTASATCGPLADGRYKWQARGKDSNGATGTWVQY